MRPGGTVVITDLAHVDDEYAPYLARVGMTVVRLERVSGTFPPQRLVFARLPESALLTGWRPSKQSSAAGARRSADDRGVECTTALPSSGSSNGRTARPNGGCCQRRVEIDPLTTGLKVG